MKTCTNCGCRLMNPHPVSGYQDFCRQCVGHIRQGWKNYREESLRYYMHIDTCSGDFPEPPPVREKDIWAPPAHQPDKTAFVYRITNEQLEERLRIEQSHDPDCQIASASPKKPVDADQIYARWMEEIETI